MDFLEVEDIKAIATAKVPQTQGQIDRENYEDALERDRLEQMVTDE